MQRLCDMCGLWVRGSVCLGAQELEVVRPALTSRSFRPFVPSGRLA